MSNKLKHLDVLCFPTLFPSGKFGESYDRKVPISLSEFGKSHLLRVRAPNYGLVTAECSNVDIGIATISWLIAYDQTCNN